MALSKYVVFALFMCLATATELAEAKSAQYVASSLRVAKDGQWASEYWLAHWDEADGVMYDGDSGLAVGHCQKAWRCMLIPGFEFAVPQTCVFAGHNGTWEYGSNKFAVLRILNSNEKDKSQFKYLIEVRDGSEKQIGTVVYSQGTGVESFSRQNGKHAMLVYYLSNGIGAAAGGCVVPSDSANSHGSLR